MKSTDPDSMSLLGRPAAAVDKKKREHIIFAAKKYIDENPVDTENYYKRFDIIEVYHNKFMRRPEIHHIENAFKVKK